MNRYDILFWGALFCLVILSGAGAVIGYEIHKYKKRRQANEPD